MVTQQLLRERLNYDPETGEWTHRFVSTENMRFNRFAGQKAGVIDHYGYRLLTIHNEKFRSARLAWLYMTGQWPQEHIDHINVDRADDRWINLRAASASENMRNTKLRADNQTGCRGVSWNKRKNAWHVRVTTHGVTIHVGYFSNLEEAKMAREACAAKLHGQFARFDSAPSTTPN